MIHPIGNIKGIVFDLDDTLYPQISYKRSGFNVVSAWAALQFNLKQTDVLSELEHILAEHGPSYPFMFNRLVERLGVNTRYAAEMVRLFIEHEPRIRCFDGVLPMLSRLRCKYRLGILTDGRLVVQERKLSALGLNKKVDKTLCSDAMGLEKPAPELFAWFEQQFELDGHALVYVGDNPEKDFHGANTRRWFTVCVMTGENRVRNIDPLFIPDTTIPSVTDVERFLRSTI